jgi:hypothetical protein
MIVAQRAAYSKQQGKFHALREGDANTRYFHARASGHAWRNAIRVLEVDGDTLVAHDDKVAALTTYYSSILGGEVATNWRFDLERLYEDRERVEHEPLVAPFME